MPVFDVQYDVVKNLVNVKETASYYTSRDGAEVIRELLVKYVSEDGRSGVVADPFMGSGVLLTAIADVVKPSLVVGIEINREPCELGRQLLARLYQNVDVQCGDAFKLAWRYRADVIVSNPPFTRWQLVRNRDEVLKAVESRGYGRFINRRDPGLHILSFFLMDYMLKPGGYMALVMPASAFYTEQGEGLKQLVKAKYEVLALVENAKEPSFSRGSGFKELIIMLRKRVNPFAYNPLETDIYRFDGELRLLGGIDLSRLPRLADRNWLSLFNYGRAAMLIQLIERGLRNGLLRYLNEDEIVRGIEMYGPDFFFIPNKYWKIDEETWDYVVITNNNEWLEIPRRYLVPCLRKPEYYESEVLVRDPGFYVLAINERQPSGDVLKYIKWGERVRVPALKFGSRWYQYAWRQLAVKKPFGHVFIHDKVVLSKPRVLANYSPKPLCASKDFYIVKTNNPLIAAWYNSSIFRDILAVFGRKISEDWTRLLEDDYLSIPIPAVAARDVNLADFNSINAVINKYLNA